MRVNKDVNDLNYLGRFGGIWDFSRRSEQKGLFVNPFWKIRINILISRIFDNDNAYNKSR